MFWFGLCEPSLFAAGLALLWWSNSLILLCTASIIFQWSSAVAAGRVTAQEMQRTKKFGLHHPLVFLHSVHLLSSLGGGIDAFIQGPRSTQSIAAYTSHAKVFLTIYRVVNVVTVAIDAICACYVACQLRERLLSAAMTDEMKKKSVIQMTLLIVVMTISLLMQTIMDIPVLIMGLDGAFKVLTLTSFCILKFFGPGVLLSACFLYIMRRVEQREPARLVIAPSQSLVEFEECAVPCVWCSHHRRFHGGGNNSNNNNNKSKWDPTFLSPLTTDSSFRSAQSSTHAGIGQHPHHPVQELWSAISHHTTTQPSFQMQQDQQQHQIRFSVDEGFPQVRFSPETERQYYQHFQQHHQHQQQLQQQHQQAHAHGRHVRGSPGAPYS